MRVRVVEALPEEDELLLDELPSEDQLLKDEPAEGDALAVLFISKRSGNFSNGGGASVPVPIDEKKASSALRPHRGVLDLSQCEEPVGYRLPREKK